MIIRRKYVGGSSNDIGFAKQADGTYQAFISDYDKNQYDKKWQDHLCQRYSYNNLKEEMSNMGFDVESEETTSKGEIVLQCVNYSV